MRVLGLMKEKKDRKDRWNVWNNYDWEFSQINVRYQTTDSGNSENTKSNKCQKVTPNHIIFKLQKVKDKEKNPKRSKHTHTLYL